MIVIIMIINRFTENLIALECNASCYHRLIRDLSIKYTISLKVLELIIVCNSPFVSTFIRSR